MIIDCHYHLDTRYFSIDEMIQRMDASGIDKVALMAAMNEPFKEPPVLLVKILNTLLSHTFTQWLARVFVENFTTDGDIKISGKTYKIYHHPNNSQVFEVAEKFPKRFFAWVFVRPNSSIDPIEEVHKWIKHPQFIGVKAHPFWHRYPPKQLIPIAKIISNIGKPLLIHAGYDEHGDFFELIKKIPDLKLILAHAAFPGYSSTWKKIKNNPNVFVDLSQTSYVSEAVTKSVVKYLGADRCLYGTDGPYGFSDKDGKFDFSFIKRRIEKLFPSKEMQQKILGGNFKKIVGLGSY
ncbi:MAG: amidohydrolase family protein [Spirochaetes bacterium]|nr:amidohydrolase family protein [Spirochaetota bacterium]